MASSFGNDSLNDDDKKAATLCPTSFNLDSLSALTSCALRKTNGWCFTPGPMVCLEFFV